MNQKAIGIFDSGVGGLTVLRQIKKELPHESVVYFGDTARVPYGSKSAKTIERYCIENTIFLLEKNIKMLVVACNTASAYGISKLKRLFNIPVVGVIHPGARAAAAATKNKRVAVLATRATVASEVYPKAIHSIDPSIEVISQACPLLVPMIEERMGSHPAASLMIEEYLQRVREKACDTILLGCTHYPLLHEEIKKALHPTVCIVDSATTCSKEVKEMLVECGLENHRGSSAETRYFVSDDPEKFRETGERFLNMPITDVLLEGIH